MTITTTAPTEEELTDIAINRIVESAGRLSRDPELDVWKEVYEPAKKALAELHLSPATYQSAVAALTEALKV